MKRIQSIEEFKELVKQGKKLFLLKHSTRCGTSGKVFQLIEEFSKNRDALFAVVFVIENRDLSNFIESFTGIEHESPQLIVIEKGKPVKKLYRSEITEETLEEL